MSQTRQFKYGVLLSYTAIIFNMVVGLVYTPWMISQVGKANYGLYVLVTSFLAYFTADYGLWQAVNKMVVERHVKQDYEGENRIIGLAMTIYCLIDIVIALALLTVYFHLDALFSNLTTVEMSTFRVLFLIATCFAVCTFPGTFFKGVFMAREYFVVSQTLGIVHRLVTVLLTIVLLYCGFGVVALVVAYGIVPFASRLFEFCYLRHKGIVFRVGTFDRALAKEMFTISIWLFLIVFAEMFTINITPSLLARLSNTSQIAIFSIGLTLYNYVYMFAGAINGFFLPTIYRHRNSDDNEGILRIGAWASSIQFYVVGLCVFGIAAVGRDFIDLWVGDSFSVSWWVALLLLSPCIITFSQAVEWTELFASNKLQYGAIVRLCTAVSTLVLSIVLIPKYHAVGSALAIGISFWIFQVFVMNFVYAKVLKRSRVPFLKVLCRYLVVWVVALWIYYRVSPLIWHHTSWINLLTQALCFGILYTVLAYAIAIPRDVKQFVLGPMLQRISKLLRIRHN